MSELPANSPLNYATPPSFGGPAKSPRRFRNGLFGWLVFIGLAVMLIILVQNTKKARPEITLSEFYDHLSAGDVMSLTIESDAVVGAFRSPIMSPRTGVTTQYFRTVLPSGTTGTWAFSQWLLENKRTAQIDVSNDSGIWTTIILPLVPWILIFGFIWFFVFRQLRRVGKTTPSGLPAGPIEVIIVNRESK